MVPTSRADVLAAREAAKQVSGHCSFWSEKQCSFLPILKKKVGRFPDRKGVRDIWWAKLAFLRFWVRVNGVSGHASWLPELRS